MKKRNNGRGTQWAVWLFAAALAASVPASATDFRRDFDHALATGDLDGAERASEGLGTTDRDRLALLKSAKQIQSFFDKGEQQIEEGDFAAISETWNQLDAEFAKIRFKLPAGSTWLEAKLKRFQGRWTKARDDYVTRLNGQFDKSLQEEHWEEAKECIRKLEAVPVPVEALGRRLETARVAAVEASCLAVEASCRRHLGEGDFSAAGRDLTRLEGLGADTQALREEWMKAYSEDCENRIAAALDNRDYDGAEAFAAAFREMGKDPEELRARVLERHVRDADGDFEAALRDGRMDDAERRLAELEGLGADTGERRERSRLARIDDIRKGLPPLWAKRKLDEIRAECDLLAGLGDDISGELAKLEAVCREEETALLASIAKWTEGVKDPDFAAAEEAVAAFGKRWTALLDRPETGVLLAALDIARQKYDLRPRCSEGPLSGGCPEYWLRCTPDTLNNPEEGAQIEGLQVQLVGTAKAIHRSLAGATYRLEGHYGDSIPVETGARTPVTGQWIYLLAKVHLKNGRVVLEELRHVALSNEYWKWRNEGGDDFSLENLFRKFRREPEGRSLPPLTKFEWEERQQDEGGGFPVRRAGRKAFPARNGTNETTTKDAR